MIAFYCQVKIIVQQARFQFCYPFYLAHHLRQLSGQQLSSMSACMWEKHSPLVCSSCLLAFPGSPRWVWNAMREAVYVCVCVRLNLAPPAHKGGQFMSHCTMCGQWVARARPSSSVSPLVFAALCNKTLSLLCWFSYQTPIMPFLLGFRQVKREQRNQHYYLLI